MATYLKELDKSLDVGYQNVFSQFHLMWCVWGLIVTISCLEFTWKIRPKMGIFTWSPHGSALSSHLVVVFYSCNGIHSIV